MPTFVPDNAKLDTTSHTSGTFVPSGGPAPAPVVTPIAAKQGSGGGGGFGGFLHAVLDSPAQLASGAANLGAGVVHMAEHPIAAVQKIAHDYATRYASPTAVYHGLEHDPTSYILDAVTLLTGGAGALGKGAKLVGDSTLGAKALGASRATGLAQFGKSHPLQVPDFAQQAGQKGTAVTIKQSSANPLIRARQSLTNDLMTKLPAKTPVVGNSARIVKALANPGERAGAGMQIAAVPAQQAFDKLSTVEQQAYHLMARGVHNASVYKAHILASPGEVKSAAMLKLLDNPKLQATLDKPSANLKDALAKNQALSDQQTAMKIAAGHLDATTAAESPYHLLRSIGGARWVEPTAGTSGVKTGLVGGKSIPVIAKELAAAGKPQPFYIHDAAEGATNNRWFTKPTGFGQPDLNPKQNTGALANAGMLKLNDNPVARSFLQYKNQTQADLFHDELVKHAAVVNKGEAIPNGYEPLKLNRGESTAPYTERIGGQFEHGLAQPGLADRFLAKPDDLANHVMNDKGQRLVVPTEIRNILENSARTPHGVLHNLLINQPTSVWKHLVLGLRPAFFGNITVGNSVLGALQMAPGHHGPMAWLNQITPHGERLFGSKLTKDTVKSVLPEQALGSFGHSAGFTSNKGLNIAKASYQGLMPATIRYEDTLRRSMIEGWAKATPEVRAAMKANGGDVNQALRDVARIHPHIINDISKRTDDALGNYRTYNRLENKIRGAVPFYGWQRHIARSVGRLASERPGTVNAVYNVGKQGQATNDKTVGPLPAFLEGAVKTGHLPAGLFGQTDPGRVPLLSMHQLNPLTSAVDLGKFGVDLLHGRAGTHSETLAANLHPFIQSAIEQLTGRSLLSGAALPKHGPNYGPIGNTAYNTVAHLPQTALISAALGHGQPPKPTSLYQHDLLTQLWNFLGVPIKKVNPATAALLKAKEGQPPR